MGSKGKLLFDLNEPATEDDEETDHIVCLQPQKTLPSTTSKPPDLFVASIGSEGIKSSNCFSHASSVSGFQPFIRPKLPQGPEVAIEQKRVGDCNIKSALPSKSCNGDESKAAPSIVSRSAPIEVVEREEGECCDVDGSTNAYEGSSSSDVGKSSQDLGVPHLTACNDSSRVVGRLSVDAKVSGNTKAESSSRASPGVDQGLSDHRSNSSKNSDGIANGDAPMDAQEETSLVPKQREVKGIEVSNPPKFGSSVGKRKMDQHKEAMLGKKRNRQTMLINIDEVKQVGTMKSSSTPRRQPIVTRTVKEVRTLPPSGERAGEKNIHPIVKDQKQVDLSCTEGGSSVESSQPKPEYSGDFNHGQVAKSRKPNGDADFSVDLQPPPVPRQSSWKQPAESRQSKNSQFSDRKPGLSSQSSLDLKFANKKSPAAKKPIAVGTSYQDTSVERLIREVTNKKFWHDPGPQLAEEISTATCGGRHLIISREPLGWKIFLSTSLWFIKLL